MTDMATTIIGAKVHAGMLPHEKPLSRLIRKGRGGLCDGCNAPIEDIEVQLKFKGRRTWVFHRSCAAKWRELTGY